ncbi:MAG: hypothetical protein WD772_00900 [Pseudohongiellaceae bacterium]
MHENDELQGSEPLNDVKKNDTGRGVVGTELMAKLANRDLDKAIEDIAESLRREISQDKYTEKLIVKPDGEKGLHKSTNSINQANVDAVRRGEHRDPAYVAARLAELENKN